MAAGTREEQRYFEGTINSVCARRAHIQSDDFKDLVRITVYTRIDTGNGETQQIRCVSNDVTEKFGTGDKVKFQVEKLKNITATVVKLVSKGAVKLAEVKGMITSIGDEFGYIQLKGKHQEDMKFFDRCCAVPFGQKLRYV